MKNRYIFRAHISERKFRRMLRLFALDLNAVQIADLTRISRNSVNRYLHLKECEFRFNHRHEEVDEILLDSCRKMPIKFDPN